MQTFTLATGKRHEIEVSASEPFACLKVMKGEHIAMTDRSVIVDLVGVAPCTIDVDVQAWSSEAKDARLVGTARFAVVAKAPLPDEPLRVTAS